MGSESPSAVVFAYHSIGVRCLRVILARGVHVPLVITHQDSPSETIWFDSVADTCREHSIPFITPTEPKSAEFLSQVEALQPDFIFSFYYRYILPEKVLQIARRGAYNIHGSLLPRYRGRVPVNWALLHGETETGVTLHEMVAKPDAGAIIAQLAVPILPDDTAFEVFNKLVPAAEKVLWDIIPQMLQGGEIPRYANDISRGSYFGGRKPEDGRIDWSRTAQEVYNLHRAVAPPYPGAWTEMGAGQKLTLGKARMSTMQLPIGQAPGLCVLDGKILGVCGDSRAIEIQELVDSDQQPVSVDDLERILVRQRQMMNLDTNHTEATKQTKQILLLGINGFIGHHLLKRILEITNWCVTGLDLHNHRIQPFLDNAAYKSRLFFKQGDMRAHSLWIENQIKHHCDIVLPLAAIATPRSYIQDPLSVFELDFEANLTIVRQTAEHGKRLVFPSTSEVYGMCRDDEFNPETSDLVCGPIHKTRWMYSCSKQLMDRVIWAYGMSPSSKSKKSPPLDFTIFRPFNWIGTGLDSLDHHQRKAGQNNGGFTTTITSSDKGSQSKARVTTQFLNQILNGHPITLVNGGSQKRTFTHIQDGIDALMLILAADKDGITTNRIYNIGNPQNHVSIRGLADLMLSTAAEFTKDVQKAAVCIVEQPSEEYYGEGYQDVQDRLPNIKQTVRELGWIPKRGLEEAVRDLFHGAVAARGHCDTVMSVW